MLSAGFGLIDSCKNSGVFANGDSGGFGLGILSAADTCHPFPGAQRRTGEEVQPAPALNSV